MNIGLTDANVHDLVISGESVIAGFDLNLFVSPDNGRSWKLTDVSKSIARVNVVYTVGPDLYAGTDYLGIYRSTDGGTSWTAINGGWSGLYVNAFASSGASLFATVWGIGGLSVDQSWTGLDSA